MKRREIFLVVCVIVGTVAGWFVGQFIFDALRSKATIITVSDVAASHVAGPFVGCVVGFIFGLYYGQSK